MQQGNRVFVLNMRGEPLMPFSQRKARILLKEGKAIINKYNPFTIQLTYATGETKKIGLTKKQQGSEPTEKRIQSLVVFK